MNFPGKFFKRDLNKGFRVVLVMTYPSDDSLPPENLILNVYSKDNIMRWKRYGKDGIILESIYNINRANNPTFPPYEEMIVELRKFLIKEML